MQRDQFFYPLRLEPPGGGLDGIRVLLEGRVSSITSMRVTYSIVGAFMRVPYPQRSEAPRSVPYNATTFISTGNSEVSGLDALVAVVVMVLPTFRHQGGHRYKA